jgi:hypothetical protein
MQPFHVKQIWVKKGNEPLLNTKPLKKKEEPQEEKPSRSNLSPTGRTSCLKASMC